MAKTEKIVKFQEHQTPSYLTGSHQLKNGLLYLLQPAITGSTADSLTELLY
jgi:hypothetical protein